MAVNTGVACTRLCCVRGWENDSWNLFLFFFQGREECGQLCIRYLMWLNECSKGGS